MRKVMNSRVRMKFPFWEVKTIEGERLGAKSDHRPDAGPARKRSLDIDAIVFNIGFLTNLGPIEDWGLELEHNAIKVDSRMRTNIEGVYAAGDIVTYDGKLKLISTGCGEVAIAVNNAKNYIDPKAKVSPGHSTDKHELVQKKWARIQAQEHAHQRRRRKTSDVFRAAKRVSGGDRR